MLTRLLKITFCLAVFCCPSVVSAQINGFTEPFRKIELASDEAGSIAVLNVEEGDAISKGDVVAQLDDRVQVLQVESAQHLFDSRSAAEAAERGLKKRQMIAKRIRELISTGHATESEMIRADLEESIARAKYVASEEDSIGREIDLRRAQLMLDRRSIRAPFDAVVSRIHRQEGEFLSPLRPDVATLIQVDQLLAVFNVPGEKMDSISVSQEVTVVFANGNKMSGTIHSIGVQTDAESGTTPVKVLLNNRENKLRSGEKCQLDI